MHDSPTKSTAIEAIRTYLACSDFMQADFGEEARNQVESPTKRLFDACHEWHPGLANDGGGGTGGWLERQPGAATCGHPGGVQQPPAATARFK